MRFYVIFEGTDSGVFDSCALCRKVVYGCPGNNFQSYSSYDEAVVAWEVYCDFNGHNKRFCQDRLLQPKHNKPVVQKNLSSPNTYCVGSTSEHTTHKLPNTNYFHVDEQIYEWESLHMGIHCYAENTTSNDWIYQLKMQKQLVYVCRQLKIEPPVYGMEEVVVINGINYMRSKAYMQSNYFFQDPFVCYGRFAKTYNDAKEDVAVMVMRRLLCTTGMKVRDYNFYNVRILQEKIYVIEAEKMVMLNEIQKLTEQLHVQNVKGKGKGKSCISTS